LLHRTTKTGMSLQMRRAAKRPKPKRKRRKNPRRIRILTKRVPRRTRKAKDGKKKEKFELAPAVMPRKDTLPALPKPSAAAFMEAFSARITGTKRPMKADNETQAFALAARAGVILKAEAQKQAEAAAKAAKNPQGSHSITRGPTKKPPAPADMAGMW